MDEDEKIALAGFKRVGFGFNAYDDEGSYRTDSPKYRAVTQATFIGYLLIIGFVAIPLIIISVAYIGYRRR